MIPHSPNNLGSGKSTVADEAETNNVDDQKGLKISNVPALEELRMEVTKRCNAACAYCYLKGSVLNQHLVLGVDDIRRPIEQGLDLGLKRVSFTGGEPLLYSSHTLKLIQLAKSLGLEAGLLTNGLLCSHLTAKRFREAELDWVRLSCDSSPEDKEVTSSHRRQTRHLPEVVDALRCRGITVFLRATVSRFNAAKLADLCRFALSCGVSRLELQPFFPTGTPQTDQRFLMPPQVHLQAAAEAMRLRKNLAGRLALVLYSGWFEFLSPEYDGEPVRSSRCGRTFLFIDNGGFLKTCGPAVRLLGESARLLDIWETSDYLKRLRNPESTGICRQCKWFVVCRFWCPATNSVFHLPADHPTPACPKVMARTRIASILTKADILCNTQEEPSFASSQQFSSVLES